MGESPSDPKWSKKIVLCHRLSVGAMNVVGWNPDQGQAIKEEIAETFVTRTTLRWLLKPGLLFVGVAIESLVGNFNSASSSLTTNRD